MTLSSMPREDVEEEGDDFEPSLAVNDGSTQPLPQASSSSEPNEMDTEKPTSSASSSEEDSDDEQEEASQQADNASQAVSEPIGGDGNKKRKHSMGGETSPEHKRLKPDAAEAENASNLIPELTPPPFPDQAGQVNFPTGWAGKVGQFMFELNAPVTVGKIAERFKADVTRSKLDQILATLVEKGFICHSEEGSKLYWMNQELIEKAVENVNFEELAKWKEHAKSVVQELGEKKRHGEERVKELLLLPTDEELVKSIADGRAKLDTVEARVKECDQAAKAAAEQGLSADELHAQDIQSLKKEIVFYRKHWRERKQRVMCLVDDVCEGKGWGKAKRRELIEEIGIETDEEAKVTLLKGATIG